MLSVSVDEGLARAMDKVIASSGLYSSRSEFLKDAIRKNLTDTMEVSEDLKSIRKGAIKLGKIARKRGYKGGLLSREEKDRIAREYIKRKGIKIT